MSWKAGEEIMYRGCRFCPVFRNEQLALIKLYEFESKLAEAKSIIEAALKAQRNLPLPQDMKIRLTFEFGDFEKLRAALSLCVVSTTPKEVPFDEFFSAKYRLRLH